MPAPPDEYLYGKAGKRNTRNLLSAIEEYDICATSLFISFPNQNWKDQKNSIGLIPPSTRAQRVARACRSADWGKELGITQIASHVGYIPEDADDSNYSGFVETMKNLCLLLDTNGQLMCYETGQESVKALARTIQDIGVDNQRINFDPANLLMYNQDDPMDLVKNMGRLIAHVHCKDGCRPTEEGKLGRETVLGEGETNFTELFRELYRQRYRGPLTIEREIKPGPELDADTKYAVELLEKLKSEIKGAKS